MRRAVARLTDTAGPMPISARLPFDTVMNTHERAPPS